MKSHACLPLPSSFLQICSPAQQKAEPVSREYTMTMSPGPIRHYTANVSNTAPPRTAPPIVILYEALQTATSPLAEASPMAQRVSFGLAPGGELQGASALPLAARQKESFESSNTSSALSSTEPEVMTKVIQPPRKRSSRRKQKSIGCC
eukprot:symbB.v1.2.009376.t1/scaffold592.1/size209785/17